MDRTWIDRYAAGADAPARGIAGLSPDDLNKFPVPGTWSIQQIVVHLMDSDLIGTDRMKRVIAEDRPLLIGYDETRFAASLHYESQDAAAAAEVFRLNRLLFAGVLRQLPDEAFGRAGVHSERGLETLADLVKGYVNHLDHHMKFLREKRRLIGKPL